MTCEAWDIPPDNRTLGRDGAAEILAERPYPETSRYRQGIDFIDFTVNGQSFTQVVVAVVGSVWLRYIDSGCFE